MNEPAGQPAVVEPSRQTIYRIALCSGEVRRWSYLGPDARSEAWWRDMDTGLEFNESSLMYAWQIAGEDEVPPPA